MPNDNLPAAVAVQQPCNIVGESDIDRLVIKYLGGAKGNITEGEKELLLFALYLESKGRGGIAARGTQIMDDRLRLQGAAAAAPPQAK